MTQNIVNNYAGVQDVVQIQAVSGGGSSTTSVSAVDITGTSVTITPTSTSNKILILASFSFNVGALASNNTSMYIQCLRNGTIVNGTPYAQLGGMGNSGNSNIIANTSFVFMDNPATTSALTYKFQQYSSTASITVSTNNVNVQALEVVA